MTVSDHLLQLDSQTEAKAGNISKKRICTVPEQIFGKLTTAQSERHELQRPLPLGIQQPRDQLDFMYRPPFGMQRHTHWKELKQVWRDQPHALSFQQ